MEGKGRFGFIVGLVLALLFVTPFNASAQEKLRKEIRELKERIQQLEKNVEKNQEESKAFRALKEKFEHLSIGGGVTGIIQGADMDSGWDDDDAADGSYSADLEVEVDMDRWGTGFLHLETGDGDGVTDEIGCLTGTNADAMGGMENDLEISEALWTFGLLDDRLNLTAGKLDPVTLMDDNRVAKDETTQFMADIFVDQLAMEWPDDYTPGFQAVVAPCDFFDLKMVALSADTDWEDLFNHMFYGAEIAVHPEFNGLEGNYRLYGWGNDRHHVEWGDVADEIEGYSGLDPKAYYDDEDNYGIGLSIDQRVASDITLFARYGWQNDDIAAAVEEEASEGDREGAWIFDENGDLSFEPYGAVEQSWSVGGQITGERWSRPDDVFGMAVGMAMINDDYEDYLEDYADNRLVDGAEGDAGDELHFEAYYSFCLNEYLAVSLDTQIIDNPRGDEDADTVYMAGLRTQISF
ncbi:MAG: carbohydrate porin [Desulfobacterales bacterium]|nr:carbohydrate porin [Desulfobacterales bacterium]